MAASGSAPPGEDHEVVSHLSGAIRDLDWMTASLLFAEISSTSYLSPEEAEPVFNRLGFDSVTLIDRDGAQAYRVTNDRDLVIACRGTEPDEFNDIRADLNALTAAAEVLGRVHRGFNREVDDLWPHIRSVLSDRGRDVWFTGHSLGAAMATICAHRCQVDPDSPDPRGLYTFGSPRVGNRRYVRAGVSAHERWVNNNDVVTRVPPVWMGYQHCGTRRYVDSAGRVRRMGGRAEAKDRWAGFVKGIKRRRLDQFSDHSIADYVRVIRAAVDRGDSPRR